MKNLILAVALVLVAIGCSTVDPGQSALVVRSEQTQEIAFAVFDRYVTWEYANRETLSQNPEFKKLGDLIRTRGLEALEALHRVTKAYKDNRTPENLADLRTWIVVVEGLQTEAILLLSKSAL